jgi:hypothetical protein
MISQHTYGMYTISEPRVVYIARGKCLVASSDAAKRVLASNSRANASSVAVALVEECIMMSIKTKAAPKVMRQGLIDLLQVMLEVVEESGKDFLAHEVEADMGVMHAIVSCDDVAKNAAALDTLEPWEKKSGSTDGDMSGCSAILLILIQHAVGKELVGNAKELRLRNAAQMKVKEAQAALTDVITQIKGTLASVENWGLEVEDSSLAAKVGYVQDFPKHSILPDRLVFSRAEQLTVSISPSSFPVCLSFAIKSSPHPS